MRQKLKDKQNEKKPEFLTVKDGGYVADTGQPNPGVACVLFDTWENVCLHVNRGAIFNNWKRICLRNNFGL